MVKIFSRIGLLFGASLTLGACGANPPTTPQVSNTSGTTLNSIATPLTWTAGLSLPAGRSQAAAVNSNGTIVVLGGSTTTATDSILSLNAGAWVLSRGKLDKARLTPGAVPVAGGAVVFGGGDRAITTSTNKTLLYTIATAGTTGLRAMNEARSRHAFAGFGANTFAIGGTGVDALGASVPLATVELVTNITNNRARWVEVTPLPEARVGAAAAFNGQELYVFGGENGTGMVTNTVYHASPFGFAFAWNTLAPMPVTVENAAVVAGKNNLIYVIGGSNGTTAVNTVQVYNTASNTWSLENPLPVPLNWASAVIDSSNRIMVIGGKDASGTDRPEVYTTPQGGAAAVFTSAPVITATITLPYSYQVTATGLPAPTFSIASGPSGMSIDANGLVSWTPTIAQFGPQDVTIQASSIEGNTNQSFTIDTKSLAPSVPTGLVASSITEHSYMLSWEPSTAAIGTVSYEVFIRTLVCGGRSGCRFSFTSIGQTALTTLNFASILTGTTTTYVVKSIASSGPVSAFSAPIVITTLAPAPPTNLTVTNITDTTVSLSWTASTGPVPIAGYRIFDGGAGIPLSTATPVVDNITGTTATVTNLLPNTRHIFAVKSFDAEGSNSIIPIINGVFSVVDITTVSLPTLSHVGAFPGFAEQVVAIVGESLTVVSPASLSTISKDYVISSGGVPLPTLSVQSGPVGMTVDSATGIVSWTPVIGVPGNYSATIRGTNPQGFTDFTFNYTLYTAGTDLLPPTAIVFPQLSNITSTSATVTWFAATDNKAVTGYKIFLQTPIGRLGVGGPLIQVGTTSTATSFNLTNLLTNTLYGVYIQAFDAPGNVSGASPSLLRTLIPPL